MSDRNSLPLVKILVLETKTLPLGNANPSTKHLTLVESWKKTCCHFFGLVAGFHQSELGLRVYRVHFHQMHRVR